MRQKRSCEPVAPEDIGSTETTDDRKVRKLRDLFSLLGPDPEQNIHAIVQQACEVVESACSLYNRLDDTDSSLVCWAGYKLPSGFPPKDSLRGHICYEATIKGGNHPVILEDISKTPYEKSDPYVKRYGLKSYLGYPVHCQGMVVGSLSIVDTRVRQFSKIDISVVASLAKALSLEEERKLVDIALRQSEDKYRQLYKMLRLLTDNVPDLIWAKDLEGRYLFVNQALCDNLLKCKQPEDAIGKTDVYFAEKEQSLGHQHTFGQLGADSDEMTLRSKAAGRFLEEGLVRNQHLVLDVHKAPFWDERGELIGTVGCGRNATREKQTAKALEDSEQRYRDLYNNTPVMLYSLDHEDRVTSVSNLWLETMGYHREEVIGRKALDFFTRESQRDAVEVSFPEFYKRGQMKNRPYQFITKSGRSKDVLLSAIARRDEDSNYAGALAFVVDVTQTKRAENEKRQLSARLLQAQKMEAIGTLAGGVAHQFNNALAVILGNLELIQMDGLADEELNRFVDPISQAGQKMVQLTSQLLAYARGGKFQTQIVAAHRFVEESIGLVNHSLAPHVKVETDLDPNTDHIEVDTTQMQMLLAAILSNASEAIEKQGTIHIRLQNIDVTPELSANHQGLKPGHHVLLRIEDNGKGMDGHTRQHIFEPFYTTKFQGRGLGMAAVYGIVKKHGGFVDVASTLGQGSTVSIYLPSVRPREEVAEKAPEYISHQTGTALIIEDEHLVMQVNRAIVEKLGYQVLEARSGQEAIEIVQNHEGEIDFALLDVILPDMGGNQIYPKLMKVRPDLKVIVCSGYSLEGPAQEILNAGAQSFIPKPFTVASLSSALAQVIEGKS